MTKPIQLMPELLILREMASAGRCCYCHGENGTHFSNCWGPDGQAAWSMDNNHAEEIIVSHSAIELLIVDNETLRERITELEAEVEAAETYCKALSPRITELEGALEHIADCQNPKGGCRSCRETARAALKNELNETPRTA